MCKIIREDIRTALEKDPAARNSLEVYFTYGGVKAIIRYRVAHKLWNKGWRFLARLIMARVKNITGIDIHPAAVIGRKIFIDHGMGVVIGETTEIGDNVTLYQGVTLGGTGKDTGKRHPTVHDNVMISAGAKVLGPIVIGEGSKIGAGSVVLKNVPSHCTVVGVPGYVTKMYGQKFNDFDQKLPDPVLDEFKRIDRRLNAVEDFTGVQTCRYSIANDVQQFFDPDLHEGENI
ncbi:MAG: serine O-acetyltransferase [Christensenellaceae bacterium]|jgi:serine O-acetyltransferase|nr:serine O-acetyltransferase [Christensenellaceae bacterium]